MAEKPKKARNHFGFGPLKKAMVGIVFEGSKLAMTAADTQAKVGGRADQVGVGDDVLLVRANRDDGCVAIGTHVESQDIGVGRVEFFDV